MNNIMTYETLRNFTYSNDKICKKPIRGIVISFFGLGGTDMFAEDTSEGKFFAEKGILYIYPYNNPWSWMNRQAVAYTDEIIDILINEYNLDENIPVVASGGSMGGQCALVYTAYAKRTPAACVASCPVCDLVFHYTERDDLPRTLYSAFFNESGSVSDVLQKASPLHLVDKMPAVKYHIFHCTDDMAVNIHSHSERFVTAMKESGHNITFDIVPDRGHCDLTEDMQEKYTKYIIDAILD